MKRYVFAGLGLASIGALSALIGVNVNKRNDIIASKADVAKSVTITKEMLNNTLLEDYYHPRKEYKENESDKKFSIDLGEGKYILGALIFRDCDYQFSGATLGDAFGINNTDENSNAYNFNILFSFEKVTNFSVTYLAHANEYAHVWHQIKYGNLDIGNFYDRIGEFDYTWIVERAGGDYGHRLFPGGDTASYYDYEIHTSNIPDTVEKEYSHSVNDDFNLVALNINCYTGVYISPNKEANFTLNSLTFNYVCK